MFRCVCKLSIPLVNKTLIFLFSLLVRKYAALTRKNVERHDKRTEILRKYIKDSYIPNYKYLSYGI